MYLSNITSRGSLEGHNKEGYQCVPYIAPLTLCPGDPSRDTLGRIPGCTTYAIHAIYFSNFISGGSLKGHLREDHIHNMLYVPSLTLCPEDPLRDMLERIPGHTTYIIYILL